MFDIPLIKRPVDLILILNMLALETKTICTISTDKRSLQDNIWLKVRQIKIFQPVMLGLLSFSILRL